MVLRRLNVSDLSRDIYHSDVFFRSTKENVTCEPQLTLPTEEVNLKAEVHQQLRESPSLKTTTTMMRSLTQSPQNGKLVALDRVPCVVLRLP